MERSSKIRTEIEKIKKNGAEFKKLERRLKSKKMERSPKIRTEVEM